MRHAKPAYSKDYAEVFDCPIYYDQPENAVVFSAEILNDVLPQAGTLTLHEIADKLGYSEQSAFSRAFRSWYNKAPGTYIKDQVQLPHPTDKKNARAQGSEHAAT